MQVEVRSIDSETATGGRSTWYQVTIGVVGEESADLFQVPVQLDLPEGVTGPLPRKVILVAANDIEARSLIRSKVEAIAAHNWHDILEKLRSLGFVWEYNEYK